MIGQGEIIGNILTEISALIVGTQIIALVVGLIIAVGLTVLFVYLLAYKFDQSLLKSIAMILMMAFFQTGIALIVLFIFMTSGWMDISVSSFGIRTIIIGETVFVFFIIFFITDLISEIVRFLILRFVKMFDFIVIRTIMVIVVQLIIVMVVVSFLNDFDIIIIYLYRPDGGLLPLFYYWLNFFIIIGISEVFIEILRFKLTLED